MLELIGLFLLPWCSGIDSFVCHPNCDVAMLNGTDHCNSTTGECLYGCLSGYAGPNCSVECPHTCASNVRGAEICNAASQECLFGCQEGYYGPQCEHKCDDTIKNCKRCSLLSDKSVLCDECIHNHYRHNGKCTECNYWCLINASTPQPSCRENDGYCIHGCQAGWYGFKCGVRCPSTCKEKCDRDLGHCLIGCSPASYCGVTCALLCSDGCASQDCEQSCTCRLGCTRKKWGDQCDQFCNVNCNKPPDPNSNICERSNGACSYKCNNDTFWGIQCDKQCSSKCNDGICEQATGNCTGGCNSNKVYGISCDKACNNNCINGTCERSDGYCDRGCVTGSYGDQCHLNCNGNCLNLRCDRTTGYCKDGCAEGMYGDQCEKECSLTCLKQSCDRNTRNRDSGRTSNSKLVAGLVSGWLVSLVLFVILCIVVTRKYHMCRVCGDKKKLEDAQSEVTEHEDRAQHEYMTLQQERGFTNSVANYDTLKTDEGDKDVQGTTYENYEAPL